MAEAYAYTPEVWPLLTAAVLVAAIAFYSWRRRDVPAALPLAACALFVSLSLLGNALAVLAAAPAAIFFWHRFQAACQLPGLTSGTCFALEYAYPGRWLTRRNLALLALAPALLLILIVVDGGQVVWDRLEIAADGSVLRHFSSVGFLVLAYGLGLVLLNAAALLWLFVRSPQHRWPVAMILFGQIANRVLYLLGILGRPAQPLLELDFFAASLPWIAMCAVALFGFRIFDPRPVARRAALEQMRDGMVAFDTEGRVASLNRAAAAMLGADADRALGRTLPQLLPTLPDLAVRLGAPDRPNQTTEISLGAGHYNLELTPLHDFRGLLVGRLLMLHDLTEQRRAEAQLVEKERTLAVLQERERLAHELHDGLGQALAAAHFQANSARFLLARGDGAQVDECLAGLADATLQAEADVREYLLAARTTLSAEHPFFPSLRDYLLRFTRQYGLPVELVVPPQLEADGLPRAVEVQLLRIIQEALSNVRKHAGARGAHVIFSPDGAQLRVAIVDDGRGFDPAAAAAADERYGLQAMRERAAAAGGSLAVISSPGQGTQVVAHVPMQEET